ncbi:MAG: hypothetical protein HC888_06930 [Candidatus Competibacteraceae bacterium]|nr:hypothetical protein [Candidatus Competibacteraceae bacterium]
MDFAGKSAWGILVYINILTLVISVPPAQPKWRYWLAILLVVTSFPSMRTSADANLEILVTMGALFIVWGYRHQNPLAVAFGILTITAKPQSALLILMVLAVYLLQTWSQRNLAITAALVAVVVIPMFLWKGQDWLKAVDGTYQRGSIIDISLDAALLRTEVFPVGVRWILRLMIAGSTLYLAWNGNRDLSREKAGFLLAAALLVAPYGREQHC